MHEFCCNFIASAGSSSARIATLSNFNFVSLNQGVALSWPRVNLRCRFTVFVSKRGQGTGHSGIENPLFYKENTRMFYGNAKASIDQLVQAI